ncbi:hypothetical protein EII12_07295 [Buchananella hordeovulneris]|uniref:hypothetical protein n=1 Tax=Buchananella hordeovulneris TaxID=52770 RepID=UPI000F5F47A7|nr:hypothetical protein [Buchananella hordeovulneris]RRD51763.1 hypothetical protein EII12_07295 [Buchananella hordeovulneris]
MKHTSTCPSSPAAALTGLLLLTGCTASPPAPATVTSQPGSATATNSPAATTSAPTPAPSIEPEIAALLPPIDTHVTKDLDRWTLPTDPYDTARLTELSVYLGHLEEEKCMTDAGFPEFKWGSDAFAPAPDGYRPDMLTPLFNQDSAAKYGYRTPPDPRFPLSEDRALAIMEGRDPYEHESPEFKAAHQTCGTLGLQRFLGGSPDDQPPADDAPEPEMAEGPTMGPPTELEVDVAQGELPAAAERWRECMAPLAIPDLPTEPWMEIPADMPKSLRDRWDMRHTFTASEDELRVATHDANCRVSSGWQQAYYDAEWDLHQRYLDKYRPALENRIAKVRAAEVELVREILKLEAALPHR